MKIKKRKSIIKMFIIAIFAILIIPYTTYADINFGDADTFINRGKSQAENNNGLKQANLDEVGTSFADIAQIMIFIGTGILVASASYMGIKYMMASPDQQAKLKQQLIGLLVSALVIYGSYFIWSTVYNLLNGAFDS